jgi:hypothetical protein
MPKWEQAITLCPQPCCGGTAEAFVEYQYDSRGQIVGTERAVQEIIGCSKCGYSTIS